METQQTGKLLPMLRHPPPQRRVAPRLVQRRHEAMVKRVVLHCHLGDPSALLVRWHTAAAIRRGSHELLGPSKSSKRWHTAVPE